MKFLTLICGILIPLPWVLAAAAQVNDAIRIVDIAREKDVVWLALATSCASIGFSCWLVYRKDCQADASTASLLAVAKAMGEVASELKELRTDLVDVGVTARQR